MLIDTHCHIHEADYKLPVEEVLARAQAAGVTKIICVGTSMESSRAVVDFAKEHSVCHPEPVEGSLLDSSTSARNDTKVQIFVALGVHPHDAKDGIEGLAELLADADLAAAKIVGVGEIGLDYHYNHSPRDVQIDVFNQQIELALKYNLPISFHVRDAFDDFWPIFDQFKNVRGVLHSFTDSVQNMEKGLKRGLYIGVNGIVTFNKNPAQHKMYRQIPLNRLLLETDAPFLAPAPHRGRINEPAFIKNIAEFIANQRDQDLETVAKITTHNAETAFKI